MHKDLYLYNTLSRKKEKFEALHPPFAGMYVCGPTVYGDPHLGHARPAITFDLVFRYLKHLGYRVRYVRNITDVGHLEHDADEGEDKVARAARVSNLEPMELVQHYTYRYHEAMRVLNTLPPSIEPTASGHIIEQLKFVRLILEHGYAYEKNGSVYFDMGKYTREHEYGELSGRVLEDLQQHTRELEGKEEKKNPLDFALWKKAHQEHIMRWPSEFGEGFPGWHLECSTMSTRYLGDSFDIHGGGMDLLFPHHECEIAQSVAALGKPSVRYWMHNNMITLNGQKMGKSLGNAISLFDFFEGKHALLDQAYSPMNIRFFMLQAHYTSTLDFSNEALRASCKGYQRLMEAVENIEKIEASTQNDVDVEGLEERCYAAMNDDFNSPVLISELFEWVKTVNLLLTGEKKIDEAKLKKMQSLVHLFVFDILGLQPEKDGDRDRLSAALIDSMLELRLEAKKRKDFQTADAIRERLVQLGIEVKDTPGGFAWKVR